MPSPLLPLPLASRGPHLCTKRGGAPSGARAAAVAAATTAAGGPTSPAAFGGRWGVPPSPASTRKSHRQGGEGGVGGGRMAGLMEAEGQWSRQAAS